MGPHLTWQAIQQKENRMRELYKSDNFVVNTAMVILTFFVMVTSAYDAWSNPPAGGSGLEDYKDTMFKGIMLQRGHMKHVTKVYAKKLVQEAVDVVQEEEYSWISPELLLGLAINESDLRGNLKRGYDCGLTQNRVTIFKARKKARVKLCKKLTNSTKLSFEHAAKELTKIKKKYCKWYDGKKDEYDLKCRKDSKYCGRYRHYRRRFLRCLLNNYNQGPRYYKEEDCKGYWKCRVRARYWKRVLCFATGVRLGKDPRWTCRRARSIKWIARAYRIKRNLVVAQ